MGVSGKDCVYYFVFLLYTFTHDFSENGREAVVCMYNSLAGKTPRGSHDSYFEKQSKANAMRDQMRRNASAMHVTPSPPFFSHFFFFF